MIDTLENALPAIVGGLLGLSLLVSAIAFRLFRRSRTDIFWRRRREAGQRGLRLLTLGVVLFLASGLTCVLALFLTLVRDDPATGSTSTGPIDNEQTQVSATAASLPPPVTPSSLDASMTPTPGEPGMQVLVVTATALLTPTETPFPTFTPNATPLLSTVTPQASARLRIVALDDQISDALTPVDPRAVFDAGTRRIYLFLEFSDLTEGVLWKRRLYRDGELIDSGSYLWGQTGSGSSYFFFGDDNGFPAGTYEIQLFIGEDAVPVSTTSFTIRSTP